MKEKQRMIHIVTTQRVATFDEISDDFDVPGKEGDSFKVKMAMVVAWILGENGLSWDILENLGISKADISLLQGGDLTSFSVGKMVGFLRALGKTGTIYATPYMTSDPVEKHPPAPARKRKKGTGGSRGGQRSGGTRE